MGAGRRFDFGLSGIQVTCACRCTRTVSWCEGTQPKAEVSQVPVKYSSELSTGANSQRSMNSFCWDKCMIFNTPLLYKLKQMKTQDKTQEIRTTLSPCTRTSDIALSNQLGWSSASQTCHEKNNTQTFPPPLSSRPVHTSSHNAKDLYTFALHTHPPTPSNTFLTRKVTFE